MRRSIIIYGSQYGTTKRYAQKLSEMTGIAMVDHESISDLANYETIIHLGGLYAGGVKGLKHTIQALPENASIMIVTVGLADVSDPENTDNIRKAIDRQVPKEMLARAAIFHLRGGIDYQRLHLGHKAMMTLLYNKAKNLPEKKKTAEVRAMLESFNQKVDFVDYHSLDPIIEAIQREEARSV